MVSIMLSIAIIGTGAISDSHIKGYLKFPDRCKIAALVDINPDKAGKKSDEHALGVDIYDNHREALRRSDIDLVSLCLPPFAHAQVTIECLQAGKHVLVEKPMAPSLQECDDMIKAAQNNKKLLSVVAQNRFTNAMMKLKRILDGGHIGKILHMQVDSLWWRGHNYYDLWWRGTWEKEGGGCTLNHAAHHVDLFQWMMGMPDEVFAMMSNAAHDNSEVEDLSIALLRYRNESLAQITSSVVHHGEEQQLIIQGEKARLSIPWKIKASIPLENGFPRDNAELEQKIQKLYEQLPDIPHSGHAGQIDNVLSAIENGKNPLIDGCESRKMIELITAIYASASTGRIVRLPVQKSNPFYTKEGILGNVRYFYKKTKSISNFSSNTITLGRHLEETGKG
jgi:UDP-N-acetyl-2-amino-2-deoxyglucuronate dehydrogenase